jgi:carbamoyltransferase
MSTILGFCGGPNAVYEQAYEIILGNIHDSAAVLLADGEVAAAIEQERLDRIKHSNKAPLEAIRWCLEAGGLALGDVDHVAFFGERAFWDRTLADYFLRTPEQRLVADAPTLLRQLLERGLGGKLRPGEPAFVGHHLAHAVSAAALSGFDDSLVLVIDAQGDDSSGLVLTARGTDLAPLRRLPVAQSLGYFYLDVIAHLGFYLSEEYKVMGLAPYGDPSRFRGLFRSFFSLLPDGEYALSLERTRLFACCPPRRPWEPIQQVHKDLAAALQEALEELVFHLLRHFREATGLGRLCMAGGVAHNCTLNGKILASGLFSEVFVQPAAHDAGCALGAALFVHHQNGGDRRPRELRHVYWGRDLGDAAEIERQLAPWRPLIAYERVADPAGTAAQLLARGEVLGWAQGRSEFGPRALGNRSILADPRPAANKERINAMVKKREAFRPFAPAVIEERAGEFFELPPGTVRLPFMVFTVPVKPDQRQLLGAVTHVDGSARIQTVERAANPRFWELLDRFGKLTGVPMLLNTSFNNNAEPIVDSVADAVVCFLTTGLDALIAGDFLVRRGEGGPGGAPGYLGLVPSLPRFVELRRRRSFSPPHGWTDRWDCRRNFRAGAHGLSAPLFELLTRCDGRRTLGELLPQAGREALLTSVRDLWAARLIELRPAAPEGQPLSAPPRPSAAAVRPAARAPGRG